MPHRLPAKLRIARLLFAYVTVMCVLMALWLPWTGLARANAIALGRVLLFVAGGAAGWIALSGGPKPFLDLALAVAAAALVEFLWRLPQLLRHLDVAVANGGWFGVLSANSLFVALIVAGCLSLPNNHIRES